MPFISVQREYIISSKFMKPCHHAVHTPVHTLVMALLGQHALQQSCRKDKAHEHYLGWLC
jgi:hypothetical protein